MRAQCGRNGTESNKTEYIKIDIEQKREEKIGVTTLELLTNVLM